MKLIKEKDSNESNDTLTTEKSIINPFEQPKLAFNLEAPGALQLLSRRIADDIDRYCIETYTGEHRTHLGASIIGQPCARASWYTFRWVYYKKIYHKEGRTDLENTGRALRLFQRGHREEAIFIEYLRGVGFQVWEIAEDGEQHKIKGVFGHFGGSLDGGAKFPEAYQISEPILTEFKTQGTGRKFEELIKKGVQLTKPQHYAQMCVYGFKYKLKYALYMVVNKNDDSLHTEVIKLDWKFGEEQEKKAEQIISSQEPPAKIGMVPTYFQCKYCDFIDVCHNGATAEKNCRSCKAARPVENAEWFCETYGQIVPKDFIKNGCEEWKSII